MKTTRIKMNDDNGNFYEFLGALSNLYTRINAEYEILREERDRLLVLATKHCPRGHHDFSEILKIADD